MRKIIGFAFVCVLCLTWTVPSMAQDANGAGTRSAIPSTRNKPGLRSDAPEEKKEDQQGAEDSSSKD